MSEGVWIIDASTAQPLLGKVWPDNPVHYPDFTNVATLDWWRSSLENYKQLVQFDGIWLDMNEPSNFITGSTTGCSINSFTYPPYTPRLFK